MYDHSFWQEQNQVEPLKVVVRSPADIFQLRFLNLANPHLENLIKNQTQKSWSREMPIQSFAMESRNL